MRYLGEATDKYIEEDMSDNELSKREGKRYVPKAGEQWEVSFERKELLEENGFIKVIEEIKEIADKSISKKVKTSKNKKDGK